jgi:hypothetical protein
MVCISEDDQDKGLVRAIHCQLTLYAGPEKKANRSRPWPSPSLCATLLAGRASLALENLGGGGRELRHG